MADVLDVQTHIANDINAIVQPLVGTTYTPFNLPSGQDQAQFGTQTVPSIQVMLGDPILRTIMTRLELGKAQIGVHSDPHELRFNQYIDLPTYLGSGVTQPSATIVSTPSASGKATTFSGAIQAGDVVGVILGNLSATYAVQGTDTLGSVASGLGSACLSAGISASVSVNTVTITSAGEPQFSVGTSWTQQTEMWRRRKMFQADLYAATVYDMNYIGRYIEQVYSLPSRLVLQDNTVATVLSMDTIDFPDQQRDGTYTRRFRWLIDFITSQTVPVTQIVGVSDSVAVQAIGASLATTPPTSSQL